MQLLLLTRAIYPLHGYGGMERHCYDWTQAMCEAGCTIHVLTTSPDDPNSLHIFPPKVHFYFLPGKSARSVLQRITQYPAWVRSAKEYLQSFLNDGDINAVYAHGLTAAACVDLKIPVLYNPHGMEEFKTSGIKYLAYSHFRKLSNEAAQAATRVLATDNRLVDEVMQYLHVPRGRIAVIPNAVSPQTLANQEITFKLLSRFNLDQADPLFLTAGRLEANKGIDVLLEALSLARQLPQTWKLVVAGTGSLSNKLKALALRHKLEDRVLFTGFLQEDELASLYEISDLFVNPTIYEGSSIVTLEAMREGLPIVGTQTGGLPDKVSPGRNGWLVPPRDPRALAIAIEEAVRERAKWPEMGRSSAMIVSENYSWEKVRDQFLALFRNLSYS